MTAAIATAPDDALAAGQELVERLLRDRSIPAKTRAFYEAIYDAIPGHGLALEDLEWMAACLEKVKRDVASAE